MCRPMSAQFAQLAAQNPAAQFYRLDIEDVRDVALALGVRNVRRGYDPIGTFRSSFFKTAACLQGLQKGRPSRGARRCRSNTARSRSFPNRNEREVDMGSISA